MTAKKKRLLFMVLGVCLCALIAVLIGEGAISDNKKEYAERCSEFAGIWTDKDKTISLEIQRVTSEAIFFSLDEKTIDCFLEEQLGMKPMNSLIIRRGTCIGCQSGRERKIS